MNSFDIEGLYPSEGSRILDSEYSIMSRPGLHCSPLAHKTIGSFSKGSIRLSFGFFNSPKQVQYAIKAIKEIVKKYGNKFDGLITFYSSHHAIRAENALKSKKKQCNLIHSPKELSPTCGVALQFFLY